VFLNSSDWSAAEGEVIKPIELSAICYSNRWTEMKSDDQIDQAHLSHWALWTRAQGPEIDGAPAPARSPTDN